jgi:hypothetical protein
MNFILTRYLFPIKSSICLSQKLNIHLDNPRTKKEIELVKQHLEVGYNSPDEMYKNNAIRRIPTKPFKGWENYATLQTVLEQLKINYSPLDNYVQTFFEENSTSSDIIETLAKMWIIARYDDEGEFEAQRRLYDREKDERKRLKEEEGVHVIQFMENDNPINQNSKILVNYSFLLSLLYNTDLEDYYGKSFLIHFDYFNTTHPKLDGIINDAVMFFSFSAYQSTISEKDKWSSFYHVQNHLINSSYALENIIDNNNKEMLLYISEVLKVTANETRNPKFKIVNLVSILELMLVENPYERSDRMSIKRQFLQKISHLLERNNSEVDLEYWEKRLRDIYNQRSNIAHGNFQKLERYVKREMRNMDDDLQFEDAILEEITTDLYYILKVVLFEYVNDKDFVESLKTS